MWIDELRRQHESFARAGSFRLAGDELWRLSGDEMAQAADAWRAALHERVPEAMRPRYLAEQRAFAVEAQQFLARYNTSVQRRVKGYLELGRRCRFEYPWPVVAVLGICQVLEGVHQTYLYGLAGRLLRDPSLDRLADETLDVLRRTNRGIFTDSVPTVLYALRLHQLRLAGEAGLAELLRDGPQPPLFDEESRELCARIYAGLAIPDANARFDELCALTLRHFEREQTIFSFHLGPPTALPPSSSRLQKWVGLRAVPAPVVERRLFRRSVRFRSFPLPAGFDIRDHAARVETFGQAFVRSVTADAVDYQAAVDYVIGRFGKPGERVVVGLYPMTWAAGPREEGGTVTDETRHVVIVGGGFAGLNAALRLGNRKGVRVTLIDKNNHHLFQPLLYQVAMAALSPAEIAVPIRTVLARYKNIEVRMAAVEAVDLDARRLRTDHGEVEYDYLVLACGARHGYFGHNEWERYAPGLKRVEQALEIRKRVLTAFEMAELLGDREEQRHHLTFVVVGGGATGVELAGALGEMSRYTLSREFRRIDPARTRVILIEGGPRILPAFDKDLSEAATRELEKKGVSVWTDSLVTKIDDEGVHVRDEVIRAKTVLWAAGVEVSALNRQLGVPLDRAGRVRVEADLSLPGRREVFVVGDQACCEHEGNPLPGIAPVAIQQGRYIAKLIAREVAGGERQPFRYFDKGMMATIGRSQAIAQMRKLKFSGFFAWLAWLFIHIMYLIGFKNRVLVFIQWAWSYLTFRRGARLITSHDWRDFGSDEGRDGT